jgi:hypothetical protein
MIMFNGRKANPDYSLYHDFRLDENGIVYVTTRFSLYRFNLIVQRTMKETILSNCR